MKVEIFTQGKNDPKNEDKFGYSETSFVVSDGATDKTGLSFNGKTGGEIIAQLIVDETINTNLSGKDLVEYLTKKVVNLYNEINPEAIMDSKKRFAATVVCVRIENEKVLVTQVGDTSFRINGSDLYANNKVIDDINAKARSEYIKETGDILGGREHIMENLKKQYMYQNNMNSEFGYGCIDGLEVPEKFVNFFEFSLSDVKTIELISDGYFSIPDEVSIDAYEEEYKKVEEEDPDKYIKYLSTKSKDDRTIVIIRNI